MYSQPRHGYPSGSYRLPSTPAQSISAYNCHTPGTPAIRRQGSVNRIGSSRPVYGAQPYGMQQQWGQQPQPQPQPKLQQFAYGNAMNRARSTPAQPPQPSSAMMPADMKTYATTGGIPPEVEGNPNVQYVRMNWEDILGGKAGLQGLQVSMAPGNGDPNANRQIRIGLGGAEQPSDGSVPLRILSFQPVDNYQGLKEPTPVQPGQPKFSVYTGTPGQGQGQGSQGQYHGNVYSTNNRR